MQKTTLRALEEKGQGEEEVDGFAIEEEVEKGMELRD